MTSAGRKAFQTNRKQASSGQRKSLVNVRRGRANKTTIVGASQKQKEKS